MKSERKHSRIRNERQKQVFLETNKYATKQQPINSINVYSKDSTEDELLITSNEDGDECSEGRRCSQKKECRK